MENFKYILIPIFALILSQFIKLIIETIKNKKIDFSRFLDGMGGMPSSHCTLVASLTTLVYLNDGVTSSLFGVTLIFSLVIIYDAMGVRYESGEQAKLLNKLAKTNLKEKIGHKPIEALVGVIFGIIITIILNGIIK